MYTNPMKISDDFFKEQNEKCLKNQQNNIVKFNKRKYSSGKDLAENIFKGLCLDSENIVEQSDDEINKSRIVNLATSKAVKLFGARYELSSLKNFITETDEQKSVLEHCKIFLSRIGTDQPSNLLLAGGSGTGKDHLLAGIAKRVMFDGKKVEYKKFYMLHDECLISMRDGESWYKKLNTLIKVDVAMIGEVGMQSNTEFERKILYHIMDERSKNLLPTIFTTNLSLNSFKNIVDSKGVDGIQFDRTYDRIIQDCIICQMDWDSYRRKDV